jgi:hypothetical protein
MLDRREELQAFKTNINLMEYAASSGYAIDRKASSRSSAVMRHADGDKVVIARGQDGHWIYFSVRDENDSGTIIDFVQRRRGVSLSDVRKELRPWVHSPTPGARTARPETDFPSISPTTLDLLEVHAHYERTQPTNGRHRYLETERCIPLWVLSDPRFSDCIRTDQHGNAIFPHRNVLDITGFEIKNHGFTGFSPGGEKSLWQSATTHDDTALVVVESAIDGLSHFALRRSPTSRYVSIAGTLNKRQPDLLREAVGRMKACRAVVLAVDNDEGGDRLAASIRGCLGKFTHLCTEDRPTTRGMDWNDVLRNLHK